MSNKQKYLPVENRNVPDGGIPQKMVIPEEQRVYSSFTGKHVWTGPMPRGIMGDAPPGHQLFGKPFHVVVYSQVDGSFMVHDSQRRFK